MIVEDCDWRMKIVRASIQKEWIYRMARVYT